MNTQEFLARVLPEDGVKFIAVPTPLSDNRGIYWKHVPCETFDQMAAYAHALDKKELQVYFACASYAEPMVMVGEKKKYRIRENIKSVKSFWLDIDCGEGKDYASQPEGLAALEVFLASTGLPRPLIINSGNGVHCYWSAGSPIGPDTWLKLSTLLRELCLVLDLRTDAKCTTDVCRVLRPVGTHNRKREARLVSVVGASPELIDLVGFARQLKALAKTHSISVAKPLVKFENDFAVPVEFMPVSAHEIAKHCKQLKDFADAKGNVPEPLWFNMLGLLKHTVEGGDICQEWSNGHPSYDRDNTTKKIVQWQRGPATCESIRITNPSGCEGCKFKGTIKSPISLGAVLPKPISVRLEVDSGQIEASMDACAPAPAESGDCEEPASEVQPVGPAHVMTDAGFRFNPEDPEFPESMREEFSYDGHVLLVRIESASGVASVVPMCDTIIWPVSYHRNGQGAYHMVWRAVHRERTYDFEISGAATAIGGREIWNELGSHGIVPRSGKKKYMEAYVTGWFNELKRRAEETHVFSQFGWQRDGSFVVGTRQYRKDGTINHIRLAGDAAQPAYSEAFNSRGTVEEWTSIVDRAYNYEGQEQYQFMFGVGFGAPLLRLFENYGGLTVNGYSPTKGLGKSTAGKLAIGIWGDPKLLIRTKQQTTYKAYIAHCGVMNSLPVMMDEATNIEARELSDILYTFSQGTPRVILDRSGKMNMHQQSWSTMQVSTANRSMVTLVGAMKSNADAEMGRIFEYQFGKVSKLTKEDADEILGKAEVIYGAAGELYAKHIVTHRSEIEAMLHDCRRKLDLRIDLTVQDRFVSAGLACIVVGVTVAKQLGLVRFDVERLTDWLVLNARNFKESVTSSTPPVIDVFGKMLTEIAKGFIVTQNEGDAAVPGKSATVLQHPTGASITGRLIESEQTLYVQQATIRAWCARNQADYNEMWRTVIERGWADSELYKYSLGKGTREYAVSPIRCWKIDMNKMNGNEEVNKLVEPLRVVK